MPFIAALLPFVMQYVPQLVGQLFGPKSQETIEAVTTVVENVSGIQLTSEEDAHQALARIQASPEALAGVTRELTEINVRMLEEINRGKEQERQAELATLRAELADIQSARAMQVEMTRTGGVAPLVPMFLALILVIGHVGVTLTLLFGTWDPAILNSPVTLMMLTGLVTFVGMPLGFFFGSSSSSKSKDAALAQAQNSLAQSVPASAIRNFQQ